MRSLQQDSVPEIDIQTLAEKIRSNEDFLLLDVREEWELSRVKIADGRLLNIPLSRLSTEGISLLPQHIPDSGKSVYVLCHHGARSSGVTRWLAAQGWKNVYSVRGGVDEYARRIDSSVGFY
jgi:rhodanese-related sulfurtransferase